jgi:N,N-dimethylformamidase
MSFKFLTTDDGAFYAVQETGELLWYRDVFRNGTNAPDGSTGWHPNSQSEIGVGWNGFEALLAGGSGTLYAIQPTGELLWYQDVNQNGTSRADGTGWHPNSRGEIGVGWQGFRQVFSGGDGIIYAIQPTGELLWYRDLNRDGTSRADGTGWDPRSGSVIGTGWHGFLEVFSNGGGNIYGILPTGELIWYRDVNRDGTSRADGTGWHPRSRTQVGTGWHGFSRVDGGGGGIIYAVKPTGELLWYRDINSDGTSSANGTGWDQRSGSQIGLGWNARPLIETQLEGYCVPLSGSPGATIEFKISAAQDFEVTYRHLKHQPNGGVGDAVAPVFTVPASFQDIPPDAWETGCGWETIFALEIPVDWPSGLYSAHCTDGDGIETHIVFAVNPAPGSEAQIAVIANTNTWNAYNPWGGRSKYTSPSATVLSFERPSLSTSPVDDGNLNHTTRAELWLHGWLSDRGYAFDIYADQDFDLLGSGFQSYKALILNTHPEYWTDGMMANLKTYLAGGGKVLYLAGNGVYERVAYDRDNNTMLSNGGDASERQKQYFRNLTPPDPERAVLGVGYLGNNWSGNKADYCPFEVLNGAHRFFAGTGLATGDLVGGDGLNGPASGWEMDTSIAGEAPPGQIVTAFLGDDRGAPPANIELLARGTNAGFAADMTCYQTPAGGLVFAAGSLTFTGSLAIDANLGTIIANFLNECLGA